LLNMENLNFGNGLIATLKLEVNVLQRGRKSRSSREFLALVGRTPDPKAPAPHMPELPSDLGEAERKTWYAILHENPHLNYGGGILLELAINAIARAQQCSKIIAKDGGPLIIGDDHKPCRHPLTGIEVQNRKLAREVFKLLRIEVREVD